MFGGNSNTAATQTQTLAEFGMCCDFREFLFLYWEDEAQHNQFLSERLKETGLVFSPWQEVASPSAGSSSSGNGGTTSSSSSGSSGNSGGSMQRSVSAWHPLPIQLPWLPLLIRNKCVQTISFDHATNQFKIVERSAVNGIPFVEPYVVATWNITEKSSADGKKQLGIRVTLHWEYDVYSLLSGQVEYYSRAAMDMYFSEWMPHADALLKSRRKAGILALASTPAESGGLLVSHFWSRASEGNGSSTDGGDGDGSGGNGGGTWRDGGRDETPRGDERVAEPSDRTEAGVADLLQIPEGSDGNIGDGDGDGDDAMNLLQQLLLYLLSLLRVLLQSLTAPLALEGTTTTITTTTDITTVDPALPLHAAPGQEEAPAPASSEHDEALLRRSAIEALRLSRSRPFNVTSVEADLGSSYDLDLDLDDSTTRNSSSSPSSSSSSSSSWSPADLRRARREKLRRTQQLDVDSTRAGAKNAGGGLLCNFNIETLFQGVQPIPRRISIGQRAAFRDDSYRSGPSAAPTRTRHGSRIGDRIGSLASTSVASNSEDSDDATTVHTAEELLS